MRRREGGPGRKSALGRRVGSRGAASWDRFHPFGAPLPSISPHFLWCLHKCWMEERESGQSAEFFPATSLFGPGGRSPPPVGKKGEGGGSSETRRSAASWEALVHPSGGGTPAHQLAGAQPVAFLSCLWRLPSITPHFLWCFYKRWMGKRVVWGGG